MELNGNALTQFAIWYHDQNFKTSIIDFYNLPDSFRYGVYVDFFDSEDIFLDIEPTFRYNQREFGVWISKNNNRKYLSGDIGGYKMFDNRHEARTAAIEKANELFNEKN